MMYLVAYWMVTGFIALVVTGELHQVLWAPLSVPYALIFKLFE